MIKMKWVTLIPVFALGVLIAVSGCVNQEKIACLPEDREADACTTEYDPVCGYTSALTFKTYSNACMACVDQSVQYYTEGKCAIN